MALDLSGVWLKIARAETHLGSYRTYVKEWSNSAGGKPYRIVKERNEDFTRFYLSLEVISQPDLAEWSLIIGDCVSNLIAALNHLVYALAVYESHTNPPPQESALAFPIVDDDATFDLRKISNRMGSLSDAMRAEIRAVQPYNRTHPLIAPPLSILRDLANTDKHKLLNLAFAGLFSGKVNVSLPSDRSGRGTRVTNWGEIKDGAPLCTLAVDTPEPDMQIGDVEVNIAICLWHKKRLPSDPDGTNRNEATALLTLLITEVKFVVNSIAAAIR